MLAARDGGGSRCKPERIRTARRATRTSCVSPRPGTRLMVRRRTHRRPAQLGGVAAAQALSHAQGAAQSKAQRRRHTAAEAKGSRSQAVGAQTSSGADKKCLCAFLAALLLRLGSERRMCVCVCVCVTCVSRCAAAPSLRWLCVSGVSSAKTTQLVRAPPLVLTLFPSCPQSLFFSASDTHTHTHTHARTHKHTHTYSTRSITSRFARTADLF